MLNIIPQSKKVIMQINALKSQKTSGGLGDLYINEKTEEKLE